MFRQAALLFIFIVLTFAVNLSAQDQAGLTFIENKNQWNENVDFGAVLSGGQVRIGAGYFAYQLMDYGTGEDGHGHAHDQASPDGAKQNPRGHIVTSTLLGANTNAAFETFSKTQNYWNFYLGSDRSRWAHHAYGYTGVLYKEIYRGIDLKIYSVEGNMKYDYVVAPDHDPSQIAVRIAGAEGISLENGNLFIETSVGSIIEKRPVAWQVIEGHKTEVEVNYNLAGDIVTFCFPKSYDPCHELVIDPLMIFSTYSGSTADNWGSTATPGEHGNLYSAGVTNENLGGNFPATVGAFQEINNGNYDIGILKYDSLGKKLLYATHLGGSSSESPHSLVINSADELIVLGTTSSSDFPTSVGAYSDQFEGGTQVSHVINYPFGSDIFISRFNRDGTQMLASTYLGGSDNDGVSSTGTELVKNYGDQLRGDVIADSDGNIYISSVTASDDFPNVNGLMREYGGGDSDALVLKMNADLSQIIWSNFVGGGETDAAYSIKLDKQNNLFIAGGTSSASGSDATDFPVTSNAYDKSFNGQVDGWIMKIQSDGKSILASTFTGTSLFDQIYFLDLNANEEVYVYGQTTSPNFPTTPGVYGRQNSGQFLQKFKNDLSAIEFSTVFGSGRGIPDISPTAFLVNDCGIIYMSGWAGSQLNSFVGGWNTNSLGLQVSPDAFQPNTSGNDFYFIVLYDDAKGFLYGTFLGGNQSFTHVDGGTSRFDKRGTVYHAVCAGCQAGTGVPKSDFPTTKGAWSTTNMSANCNNAAFKFDLSSLRAIIQTNNPQRTQPGTVHVCMPDKLMLENKSIGGQIHEWTMGDGNFYVRNDTAAFLHEYKQEGTYLVKLKIIDERTCKGVDSTFTFIKVDKRIAKVQDDDDICFGERYQLQASGGVAYAWSDKQDFSSALPQPFVSPADTAEYFATITEATGCISKDSVTLNVIPGINPTFTYTRLSSCTGTPLLEVKSATDSLQADDVVFFDFGDGNTSDQMETVHRYEKDGLYTVRLVTNRVHCVVEQAMDIPMFKIIVPNVITPGVNDALNDFLTVQFGEEAGFTPADYGFRVSLKTYDRWGGLLFQEQDYKYDWPREPLSSGVYYYDIEVEGHSACKSWIHILR